MNMCEIRDRKVFVHLGNALVVNIGNVVSTSEGARIQLSDAGLEILKASGNWSRFDDDMKKLLGPTT